MMENFGIVFSSLHAITNMDIGRFGRDLEERGEAKGYRQLLKDSFNPDTLEGLMCRHQINIGWDGRLYDCDFNQALGLSLNAMARSELLMESVEELDIESLEGREVVTAQHCFGCSAGQGSSCSGSLAADESLAARRAAV
jgi:radical SAM/Cys-rich protein